MTFNLTIHHPVGAPLAAPLIGAASKTFTPKSSVGALLAAPSINTAPETFTSKLSVGALLAAPLINAAPEIFKERQGAERQGAASSAPTVVIRQNLEVLGYGE